jgi:hypothetical protein
MKKFAGWSMAWLALGLMSAGTAAAQERGMTRAAQAPRAPRVTATQARALAPSAPEAAEAAKVAEAPAVATPYDSAASAPTPTVVVQCAPASGQAANLAPQQEESEADAEARAEREARRESAQREETMRIALRLAQEMEARRASEARPVAPMSPHGRPQMKRFSRGLLATGITFMSVGGLVMITSAIGAASSKSRYDATSCSPSSYDSSYGSTSSICTVRQSSNAGWYAAMGISGAGLLAGVAMTAVGAVKVPVVEAGGVAVRVEANPGFAGLSGTF